MAMISKTGPLTGIQVVDSDTHYCEPPDLWTSRATGAMKARVPQIKTVDGEEYWVIDGDIKMGRAIASCSIRKDGSRIGGIDLGAFEHIYDGAWDVDARLDYMDGAGITAHIVYPNLLGFGNQKSMRVDADLRYATTQIFNDAMIEMQHKSGGRLLPMALMPWWDMKQTLAEAERCRKAGLRGINTATKPENIGLPNLGDPHWYPLWEYCSEHNLPVNFHIGAGFETTEWFGKGCWNSTDGSVQLVYGSSMMFFANYEVLVNLFLSRLLERFPRLKIVSVESGVGWIPFLLESLQHFFNAERIAHDTPLEDIFKRQIFGCQWFEKKTIGGILKNIGADNVLIMTDFPHPVCNNPTPLEFMNEAAGQLSPEDRVKVFGGNAAKLYNIPLSCMPA